MTPGSLIYIINMSNCYTKELFSAINGLNQYAATTFKQIQQTQDGTNYENIRNPCAGL